MCLCLAHPELASDLSLVLSCAVLPAFDIAWRTHVTPLHSNRFFVVGWIGVSPSLLGPHAFGGPQHLHHLLWRTVHPEGTFSFCFFWYFLVHTIYTLVNIFSSRYFKSLCLCDLSISCIRTAYLQSHSVSLFILGERTGSLLGIIFLYISGFYISIFSHPSYS
jgi:hypothetical protein